MACYKSTIIRGFIADSPPARVLQEERQAGESPRQQKNLKILGFNVLGPAHETVRIKPFTRPYPIWPGVERS